MKRLKIVGGLFLLGLAGLGSSWVVAANSAGIAAKSLVAAKVAAKHSAVRALTGPSAGKIVFMSNRDGNNEIYTINPDGSGLTRLTNDPVNDQTPTISPDGNKIVFSSDAKICEMNIDGTGKVTLVTGSTNIQPAYSPDGTKIAFTSNRAGGDFDVFVADRNGSNIRRVTFNQFGDYEPSWSPDGTRLVFATFYDYNYQGEVTVINLDGTGQARLTNTAGGNFIGFWGVNNKIVFTSYRNGIEELYTCDPDGSNQTRLTDNTTLEYQPTWSPDGEHIAFMSTATGSPELCIMKADGTAVSRVTTNTSEEVTPRWGPAAGTPIVPSVSTTTTAVIEGNSGAVDREITVSLSVPTISSVTVNYAVTAGTATVGTDFSTTSGSLTFAPNATTQTFNVPVIGDTLSETNETFIVTLSSPVNAKIGTPQAVVITNDDELPNLTVGNLTVPEGDANNTAATFTVTLSQASGRTVTTDYNAVNGTALNGTDYQISNGTLTFAPGETTKTIPVTILGDTRHEGDETFSVRLISAVGAAIPLNAKRNPGNSHHYMQVSSTLNWADANAIATATTFAGVSGHLASITSQAEQDFINANFNTQVGTWIGGVQTDTSVEPAGGWQWSTGEPFSFIGWRNGEPNNANDNEIYTQFSSGVGWNDLAATDLVTHYLVEFDTDGTEPALQTQGLGTILNDDPIPTLWVGNATLAREGNSGLTNLNFTVALSSPSGNTVSVGYATASGSATSDIDFIPAIGTLTIPAGNATGIISVPVKGDLLVEALTESFTLTLADPSNAFISDGSAIGIITDDDGNQILSINSVEVPEGNSGTVAATFTVTLSAPSTRTVTVDYSTSPGTAASGSDYQLASGTLTFAPGITTRNVAVNVIGDVRKEENETFTVYLSNPLNAQLASTTRLNPENGHRYEIVTDTLSWSDARTAAAARSMGGVNGHLATITSAAEQAFITANFSGFYAHIGALQAPGSEEPAGGWSWITGEPWSYTNWATGEPTNSNAGGEDVASTILGGTWRDTQQTFSLQWYLVEYDTPSGPAIPESRGRGTIIDDDLAPRLTINDVTVTEGGADAVFTVTLTGQTQLTATVNYTASDISARQPGDYTATNGTLSFAPGILTRTITVPLRNDAVSEPAESYVVILSNPENATVSDNQGLGTILDDDTNPAACTSAPSGLISWWNGDGSSADITGGHDGFLRNGTTYGTSKVGSGFKLDGIDDYVEIPYHTDFNFAPAGQFTIDAWVKPQLSNKYQAILVKSPANDAWDWGLYVTNDNRFGGGFAGAFVTPSTTVIDGTSWYHVAMTYNNGTWRMFVNGSLESTSTGIFITQSQGSLGIGRKGQSTQHFDYYKGLIDEVSVYGRALSATEIGNQFTADSTGKCLPTVTPTPLPTAVPIIATVQQLALPTNDLVYDKVGGKIYASVPATAPTPRANSITPIDPVAVSLGTSVAMGAEPVGIVVTDEGSYVYAALNDATNIRRFDIATQTASIQYGLGTDYSALYAEDMATIPGRPHELVVARSNRGISARLKNVGIFTDGVLQPNVSAGANVIEVASGSRVYGYLNELSSFDFVRWNMTSQGVSGGDVIHPMAGYGLNIKYDFGRIYTSNGSIFDPEANAFIGNFPGGVFVPDGAIGKYFVLTQSGTTATITGYSTATLLPVGSFTVPGLSGNAGTLIRWGDFGLAFRTSGGQVFIITSNLVNTYPGLSVGISPALVAETGGANAATGTVTRTNTSITAPLTVTLTSSDTTEATAPATVTIPANATSVTFPVAAVNDALVDGPQTVNITASATGLTAGTGTVSVTDDERATLSGRVINANGNGVAGIQISRSGSTSAFTTTGADGRYSFANIPYGYNLVRPVLTAAQTTMKLTPESRIVLVNAATIANIDFSAAYSISGTIANNSGVGIPNVLVTRSNGTSATSVVTNADGFYQFANVPTGAYTIAPMLTPAMSGTTFTPASRSVSVGTASLTNINFAVTLSISGKITNNAGAGIANILVKRTAGVSSTTALTDSTGAYTFTNVRSGSYVLEPLMTPALSGSSFSPASRTVTLSITSLTNMNFTNFFSVSGRIATSSGAGIANVAVALTIGTSTRTIFTDSNGAYKFSDVRNGTYSLTPTLAGRTFNPANKSVTVGTSSLTNQNFVGSG